MKATFICVFIDGSFGFKIDGVNRIITKDDKRFEVVVINGKYELKEKYKK